MLKLESDGCSSKNEGDRALQLGMGTKKIAYKAINVKRRAKEG